MPVYWGSGQQTSLADSCRLCWWLAGGCRSSPLLMGPHINHRHGKLPPKLHGTAPKLEVMQTSFGCTAEIWREISRYLAKKWEACGTFVLDVGRDSTSRRRNTKQSAWTHDSRLGLCPESSAPSRTGQSGAGLARTRGTGQRGAPRGSCQPPSAPSGPARLYFWQTSCLVSHADTRRWNNAGLMLAQRLRRLPNIKPALCQRLLLPCLLLLRGPASELMPSPPSPNLFAPMYQT